MTFVTTPRSQGRILDFDIETRRIGFHNGGRYNPDGCEPVALAWKWHGEPEEDVYVRSQYMVWQPERLKEMVSLWRDFYEEATLITGHYIRKFDLPILNGVMLEFGLPPLSPKMTLDTKLDLNNVAGLSQSQENLAELLKLERSKFHMNDHRWREVARLTDYGLTDARVRVRDDVLQHELLYKALAGSGHLGTPRMWKP